MITREQAIDKFNERKSRDMTIYAIITGTVTIISFVSSFTLKDYAVGLSMIAFSFLIVTLIHVSLIGNTDWDWSRIHLRFNCENCGKEIGFGEEYFDSVNRTVCGSCKFGLRL